MTDSIDNRLRGMVTQEPWDVMAQHSFRPQDHGTLSGRAYCNCGWSVPSRDSEAKQLHATHVLDQISKAGWLLLPFDFIRGMSGTDEIRSEHYEAVSRADGWRRGVAAVCRRSDIGPC